MRFRLIFILLFFSWVHAQETNDFDFKNEVSDTEIDSLEWENDAGLHVELEEVTAYSLHLKSRLEKKYYVWLQKRVDDVYPFLAKAVTEYNQVADTAKLINNKRQRKKFIKKRYQKLAEQYEKKLKDLSTSRGQILSKLIHRETGKTTYEIIKELRGGFSAFLWNATGGAFDIDLKQGFNPKKTREDLLLEVIINRGIADGRYEAIE